jgi:hypothetical protein
LKFNDFSLAYGNFSRAFGESIPASAQIPEPLGVADLAPTMLKTGFYSSYSFYNRQKFLKNLALFTVL